MCGITGFVDFGQRSTVEQLQAMAATLLHRGPDDDGHQFITSGHNTIGMGFRRLAVIDLTPAGHQPMQSADRSLTIIFNGEIYNHAEIRKELEALGHSFKSKSDTEVILNAWLQWGQKAINKFTGMFAIALYDSVQQKFYLIRDRAGVKPLYYYWHQNLLLFASELKCFHQHPLFVKELNTAALALYFQHGYVPAPHCIFKNAFKLLPGHLLTLDLNSKEISDTTYWEVASFYNKPKLTIDFKDAVEETEKILTKACNYRMIADVPVGIFLSGGYDSSLVTALLQKDRTQKLKTFTIGFEEAHFNESLYAQKVASHLGTEHYEYLCTYKEAMDIIPLLPEIYDEPFADSSAIPTYLVSKMARQQVTVALSADGGDETFAGYTKYHKALQYLQKAERYGKAGNVAGHITASLWNIFSAKNISTANRANKLKLLMQAKNPAEAFNIITQGMTKKEVAHLMKQYAEFPKTAFDDGALIRSDETLDYFLWLDYVTFLSDDILQKVDRASMAVSLEAREPLLDHHIIEWTAQLPGDFKLNNGKSKLLLREITHKYLPKTLMEREKMGFNIPYEHWFKTDLKHLLLDTLDTHNINQHEILNHNAVKNILQKFISGNPTDFQRIWSIFVFQLWLKKWMK
jgi:asparagine synthase (glutamine-hydrolysing)